MIVRIPLDEGRAAFAQVLAPPEIAILKLFRRHDERPSDGELEAAPSLFRIWVMNNALTSGRWQRIGMAPVRPEFKHQVPRFKRDPISGECSIYENGADRPATPSECRGLEPASVWSAEHVEARLRDHVEGRPHKPLQMLLKGI